MTTEHNPAEWTDDDGLCTRCDKPIIHDPMRGQCLCASTYTDFAALDAEADYHEHEAQDWPHLWQRLMLEHDALTDSDAGRRLIESVAAHTPSQGR